MGLGDFLSGVKDAAVNVGKGAAWAVRPDHWDDIAEGAGKAVEFVAENPGKTWDTAFEVGRAVVKDQLDPVNLAINAGLLAATVATGGAAAPAFVAKLGLGAKSVQAGVTAAKGIETAGAVVKGVKAADTAMDVAKGVRTGAKALDVATDVAKGVDTATDVGRNLSRTQGLVKDVKAIGQGIRESKGLERVDRLLDAGTELKGAARESVGLSRYGATANQRAKMGERILGEAADQQGWMAAGRRALAQNVAGGPANAAYRGPVSGIAKMGRRIDAAQDLANPDEFAKINQGVKTAADPMAAVEEQAIKEADKRGIGRDAGYVDRGATKEDMYSSTASGADDGSQVRDERTTRGQTKPMAGGWSPKGQHFWEGPRSQWAGGIGAGYDWRPVDPLRQISTPRTTTAGRYRQAVRQRGAAPAAADAVEAAPTAGTATPTAPGTAVDRYMGDLNEQGAPVSFSPEVPKNGAFAMSTGQQPVGSAFPTTRFGESSKRSRLRNVSTLTQPIGAIGPGTSRTGNAVIDADSSSSDDYGFDQSGQGFFDFGAMGSARADVGYQPSSPMYQSGSRTSRRTTGTLGV